MGIVYKKPLGDQMLGVFLLLASIGLLLFVALGCGKEQRECILNGCARDNPSDKTNTITEDQETALVSLISTVRVWAPTCTGGIACEVDSDGDAVLWAGMLCSVGESSQCVAAANSQSLDGKVWRAPSRVNKDKTNSSSRDMLLGFLNYLVATKNTQAANKLAAYLQANDYKLCDDAADNRCDVGYVLYGAVWGTMKRVWAHLGLPSTSEMNVADLGDEHLIQLQSQFTASGFALHLTAVEIHLRQLTNSYTEQLIGASSNLVERQPNNPFFEYLAHGKTSKAADLVLSKCPTEKPENPHQWSWQRDESEQAWKDSMGWDCIYMARLLLQE